MVLDVKDMRRRESRVLYEVSALILKLLRYPIQFSDEEVSRSSRLTPAGFASLLLGISLSLMLCGSITFFIGFLLMPWVLALVMLFYVLGILSTLLMLARAIFYHPAPKKAWKLL